MDSQIKRAADLIRKSKHTTAFTGAGVSVESGIPPFRGAEGLWSRYDPNCLDLSFFHAHTNEAWRVIREIFYDFFGKAQPNPAHFALAEMEQKGLLKAIITQNIDNLHQAAGSKTVIEFHGTAENLVCVKCGSKSAAKDVDLKLLPPHCKKCNGILKPDFIFFGEGIPPDAYLYSVQESEDADVFLVVGTTGVVFPASTIPKEAKKNNAVIIEVNPEPSNFTDSITDIFIQGKAGEVLPLIVEEILKIKHL